MPMFFFHMRSGEIQLCDEKGKECSDLGSAHAHALHLIHRAMSYLSEDDTDGWMINIATSLGTTPLTVLFPRRHEAPKISAYRGGYESQTTAYARRASVDRGGSS